MTEKLFIYDFETTGVKYWENGIHQIAGRIRIDGTDVEKFNFHVRPFPDDVIEESALAVAGVTKEQIFNYPPPAQVFLKIKTMLNKYIDQYNNKDKFHLVGYNIAAFDNLFFREFFIKNNHKYFGSYFWSDPLDCFILAAEFFKRERDTFPDFKQATVAKRLGIHVDEKKLHDADYDIELCSQIYDMIGNPEFPKREGEEE